MDSSSRVTMDVFRPREASEKSEWLLRQELAAAYRIFDYFGWTLIIFGHLTVRVPGTERHFLINPFGLLYHEVTASNLVKIDIEGNIVGESKHRVHPAGWVIHGAIHGMREDAQCIMHQHTPGGTSVAAMRGGLGCNDFYSIAVHSQVAYHDFEGATFRREERERLAASLGGKNYLILRNHGILTCGRTVAAAFNRFHKLELGCMAQWRAQASGAELITPPQEVCQRHARDLEATMEQELSFNALKRLMEKRDPTFLH
jgi:ribulose-5-phosphate 4-epimerase/fuculose-1-phosphate aldolase